MKIYLENVEFRVDTNYLMNDKHELKGMIKVGVGAELGSVIGSPVYIYEDKTFNVKLLPTEIQNRLIDIYNDIQSYVEAHTIIK